MVVPEHGFLPHPRVHDHEVIGIGHVNPLTRHQLLEQIVLGVGGVIGPTDGLQNLVGIRAQIGRIPEFVRLDMDFVGLIATEVPHLNPHRNDARETHRSGRQVVKARRGRDIRGGGGVRIAD